MTIERITELTNEIKEIKTKRTQNVADFLKIFNENRYNIVTLLEHGDIEGLYLTDCFTWKIDTDQYTIPFPKYENRSIGWNIRFRFFTSLDADDIWVCFHTKWFQRGIERINLLELTESQFELVCSKLNEIKVKLLKSLQGYFERKRNALN